MKCPCCGKYVEQSWRFCDCCGAFISCSTPESPMLTQSHVSHNLRQQQSAMPLASIYQYCAGCGTRMGSNHNFCAKCAMPRFGDIPEYEIRYSRETGKPNRRRYYKALASFISAILTSVIVGCLAWDFLNNISPVSKGNPEDNDICVAFLVLVPLVVALVCTLVKKISIMQAIFFPILIGIVTAVIVCLLVYLLTAALLIGIAIVSSLGVGTYTVYAVIVES